MKIVFGKPIRHQVWGQVRDQVWDQAMRYQMFGKPIRYQIPDQVWHQVWNHQTFENHDWYQVPEQFFNHFNYENWQNIAKDNQRYGNSNSLPQQIIKQNIP